MNAPQPQEEPPSLRIIAYEAGQQAGRVREIVHALGKAAAQLQAWTGQAYTAESVQTCIRQQRLKRRTRVGQQRLIRWDDLETIVKEDDPAGYPTCAKYSGMAHLWSAVRATSATSRIMM